MNFTRRQFVQASLATWAGASLPRIARAQHTPSSLAPRYFVTFFCRGGMDAVYTTDPKTRAEVAGNVDVPYAANAIVDAGGLQLGPHFAPLAQHAGKMALVRGIQVATANHETGSFQMLRMRTDVTPKMPALYDIIGQTRDTQALGSVTIGKLSSFEHSPGALIAPTQDKGGGTALDVIDRMSSEEIAILAGSYRKHLAGLDGWKASEETARTRDSVAQVATFFDRLQSTPGFKSVPWADGGIRQRSAADMQRVLWFLENDMARGIFVKFFMDWDSHFRNTDKQQTANGNFVPMFARFLDELGKRRNKYGALADQTVVVVGSELGRFPVLNGNDGKDHFPETSLMFFGPGLQNGDGKGVVFNRTDEQMVGRKVNMKTGLPDKAGRYLQLDDVGTTLLHLAGVEPALYGYRGERLRFLESA